jgi:hypothetical protein
MFKHIERFSRIGLKILLAGKTLAESKEIKTQATPSFLGQILDLAIPESVVCHTGMDEYLQTVTQIGKLVASIQEGFYPSIWYQNRPWFIVFIVNRHISPVQGTFLDL